MKYTPEQKREITRVINASDVIPDELKKTILKVIQKAYLYKKCNKCERLTNSLIKGKCRPCYDVDYRKTYVYRDNDFTVYIEPITDKFTPFKHD